MDFSALVAGGISSLDQIMVIDLNGNVKVLKEGETVLPGELVIENNISDMTGLTASEAQISRVNDKNELDDITDDIEQIFAALEEGQDPTQLNEEFATAAGTNSGSSLITSGAVERDGAEVLADTNFVTSGLEALGLSQTQSLSLLEAYQTSSATPVLPITLDAPSVVITEDTNNDGTLTNSEIDGLVDVLVTPPANADVGDTLTVSGQPDRVLTPGDLDNGVSYQYPVPADGESLTVTATITDPSGNTSPQASANVVVHTSISKPTIDLVASSDSGDSDTDNLTNDKTPTFSLGNIDDDVVAAGIVVLKDGVALEGTLTEEQDGTWSFTSSADLADGTYDLSVKVTDDAGNSATSTELEVIIDTEAAATITIDDDIAGDDMVNAAEAAGDVTITGTVGGDAKPGDTVTLTVNGNSTDYTGTVKADGTYSINVPGSELVADADSTIVASVSGTDEAGNPFTATTEASGDNKDGGYEVDTDISKPTIDLVEGSDTGNSDTDNLTNDTTPTFALGNIDSDADKVEVFNGDSKLGDAVKADDGTWSFTPSTALADGTYDLSVKVTDDAGNEKTSDALEVEVDIELSKPTIDLVEGSDTGNSDT
ncbi:Ig-like domain-containing protein, partial [Vibrio cortegadensis]